MKTLDTSLFEKLVSEEAPLCITIYLPVGREVSNVNSNILRFKNLIKEIKNKLSPDQLTDNLIPLLDKHTQDNSIFKGHSGCIGFFLSSNETFEIVYLPACNDAFYQLDTVFYIVPLIDLLPKLETFRILSLGRNVVKMYQGNFYEIKELMLPSEIPTTMQDALGTDLTDNHLHAAAGGSATLHGYMEITDEKDTDNERFFRIIDQAIYEHYSKSDNIPLYVATISENQHLFKKISKNPKLQDTFIDLSTATASTNALHQTVQEIIMKKREAEVIQLIELFKNAKIENLATDQLREVAQHVMDARVEHLLLVKGRKIYGNIFVEDRTVKLNPKSNVDLLNRLALIAYKTAAKIHLIHPESLLLVEGAGSINRY